MFRVRDTTGQLANCDHWFKADTSSQLSHVWNLIWSITFIRTTNVQFDNPGGGGPGFLSRYVDIFVLAYMKSDISFCQYMELNKYFKLDSKTICTGLKQILLLQRMQKTFVVKFRKYIHIYVITMYVYIYFPLTIKWCAPKWGLHQLETLVLSSVYHYEMKENVSADNFSNNT